MTKLRSSLYSFIFQALQCWSRPRDDHPSHSFPCTQCPSLSGQILIIQQFSASIWGEACCAQYFAIWWKINSRWLWLWDVQGWWRRYTLKSRLNSPKILTTTWKGRATLHSSRTREETPVGCRNPKVGLRNQSNGRSLFMTKKIVPAQFLVSGHVATRKRVFPIQTCRPPPPLSLTRTTWGSRRPRLTQPASTLWALKEANCQLCDRPPTYWSQWY